MNGLETDIIERECNCREMYDYIGKYIYPDSCVLPNFEDNKCAIIKKPVWIMWLQGYSSAPAIVRCCIESLRKNIPDEYNIIFLDKKMISEYIQIPDYIIEKHNSGIITDTHFSDIVRSYLLLHYGGCWIDATVFCSSPVPDYYLDNDLFFFRSTVMEKIVIKGSTWWIAAKKGHPLFKKLVLFFENYWKYEDNQVNYYLFHIAISRIIDIDADIEKEYREMMYRNNSMAHILFGMLGDKYNLERWKRHSEAAFIHKLSYKKHYIKGDIYNFYSALIDGKLM